MNKKIDNQSSFVTMIYIHLHRILSNYRYRKNQFAQFFADCDIDELKVLHDWNENGNCFLQIPDNLFKSYAKHTVKYKHVTEQLFQMDYNECKCRINPLIYKLFKKEWKKHGMKRLKEVK